MSEIRTVFQIATDIINETASLPGEITLHSPAVGPFVIPISELRTLAYFARQMEAASKKPDIEITMVGEATSIVVRRVSAHDEA